MDLPGRRESALQRSGRALDSHHHRDQRYCGQRLLNHLDGTGGQSLHKWSLASGTLPTGITLNTSGVLAGTPSQSGTFNFTVSASDSEATPQVASQTFSLGVQAALSITTTTVTNAISGSAYSTTLTGTGGQSPYKWNLASDTLPIGMTLSTAGVFAGTSSQSGTFNFTVSAADCEATGACQRV